MRTLSLILALTFAALPFAAEAATPAHHAHHRHHRVHHVAHHAQHSHRHTTAHS